jgi:LPXTG-motif cell wall-anchored protein
VVQLEFVLASKTSGKKEVVASAAVGGRIVRSEIRVTTLQTLPSTGSSSAPLIAWGLCIALLGCALQLLKPRLLD